MASFTQTARTLWDDDDGATVIEYGLLAALIAVAIILASTAIGTQLGALFERLANCLANANNCN
ncbi:MAG: Flp family type IVb pilin [Betaproteobacteria bacterium]|nr:MAG: Flp family type IVb pilin [Betaproteobacteria bacterium]